MLGLALLLVSVVFNWFVKAPLLAFIAFGACQLSLFFAFFIAVPGLLLSLIFMLAPVGFLIFGIAHQHQVWKTWWFWVIAALCETAGGFILAWFDANYRK
jgi:hypothetical protein